VDKSNLRELVLERLREEGQRCRCIRCREVGHRWLKDNIVPDYDKVKVLEKTYEASEGTEHFISVEDQVNDILIGYLRLRFPSNKSHRPEISGNKTSIIRELRVCGPVVPVGKRAKEAYQHKGCGKMLMEKAEETSKEHDCSKIVVTSALGTKRYYRRLGYRYDGPYMSKNL
jgi:elongator complex protein 3